MGEYQLHDFYSEDRVLGPEELDSIRSYSSRVEPTNRRASFVYHYGDFRYNPVNVLEKHFDIYLYVANWGTRQLMMKFPKELVSKADLT
jgi:hypothetical protein